VALNCYIDETGDDGIDTGGTRWLILGAIIIPEQYDLKASEVVPRIKKGLKRDPKHPLRWSKIRSHDKRLYICSELLTEDWAFSCVATDKTHPYVLESPGFRDKWNLFFYSIRLLLERLSWYARDNDGEKATLTFERRNMSYDALGRYLQKLYKWLPPLDIAWDYLDWENFRIIPKGKSRLLQVADLVCGALSDGFEYTELGNLEPRYILSMKNRFYKRRDNLFSYGLKFLHIKGDALACHGEEYCWLKELA
jgi:hypothetical protein